MKVKKVISYVMAIVLTLNICSVSVFAFENPEKNSGCYVVTEQAPAEILDYAKSVFPKFLTAHLTSNAIDTSGQRFSLGYPIVLVEFEGVNHIYDFPVMRNDEIFAILTIYDDNGSYCVQLEENLMAEKLNDLQKVSSLTSPIVMCSEQSGLFALVNGNVEPLTPDSDMRTFEGIMPMDSFSAEVVVDIKKVLVTSNENGIMPLATDSRLLGVMPVPQTDDGTFSGTQMNWCGAAVTASIINYIKYTKLTAKMVTIQALGSAKDEGLTLSNVIAVAHDYALDAKESAPLSYTSVKAEIDGIRPIYMRMQRSTTDGKVYHALCLVGYSPSLYTVLNPWYNYRLTLDKKDSGSNVTYITGDRTYTWYKSVYNWR